MPVGKKIAILGSGFTDATSVKFGKVAAKFAVLSDTKIRVTVPKGAKTGKVTVSGPGGTTTSKKRFVVKRKKGNRAIGAERRGPGAGFVM